MTTAAATRRPPRRRTEHLPPDGAVYPHVLRREGYAPWRSTLGIVLAVAALLVLPALVSRAVLALGWKEGGEDGDFADYTSRAEDFEVPIGLLAANLGIAVLALVSWLLAWSLHRSRPRWLSSVQPGLRWGFLLRALAVAAVVLVGVQLLAQLVGGDDERTTQDSVAAFLVVIALTSPLQALAEELLFRGYLFQALGSLVTQPWFPILVSATLFAAVHGAQDPALFVDRFALGVVAGLLVWRTGGLEAAIAAHAVANTATYVIATLTTSVASVRAEADITWGQAALDVAGFALFAVVALLVARRTGIRRRVDLGGRRRAATG